MIYVDSRLVIYAVEHPGAVGDRARSLLGDPAHTFAISPLVVLEALVGPMRARNRALRSRYEDAFANFRLLDIPVEAYLHAAELRAAHPSLRTADALHLSAAQHGDCSALWTNDRRLAAASAGFAIDVLG